MTPKIEELTSAYNEAMSRSLVAGWSYLTKNAVFDPAFKAYISGVSVSIEGQCCYVGQTREEAVKAGAPRGYALGYQTMLDPVTPNLVDMLVNIVSRKDPKQTGTDVVDAMEGKLAHILDGAKREPCISSCDLKAVTILKEAPLTDESWCRQRDVEIYKQWVKQIREGNKCAGGCNKDNIGIVVPPRLALSCVRRELDDHLFAKQRVEETQQTAGTDAKKSEVLPGPSTSTLGQLRAAVADFLYQYKLMVRYPNDFHAYLEPMSADTLDVALLPVVDAFYDDLGVFQEAMQDQVYDLLKAKRISYSSSGLVSMKMIAGTQGIVNSTSQNSFQLSQAASAADVSDAIASIKTDPTGAASKLIKLMTPTPVTATLGKELNLTSTVHSLSGAYGMELDLLIDSAESGTPQLVESGATTTKSDDLNSRVTTHHLQTKVRVDNLKLFEVSTARSLVARGQAPWVPLDPYFEIPVLSQLVKKPRKPKGVFTQSLLFINALVVPTAIDLAYGNPITGDTSVGSAQQATPGSPAPSPRTMREAGDLKRLTPNDSRFAIEDYHADFIRCLSSQYIDKDGHVAGCTTPPQWKTDLQTIPDEESDSDASVPSPK